ncbi:alpha/beta hydrolase [Nonomuraea sp. NPDC050310]|uniref:alpha/beta fold hydrolase n=1 Tax=Nonomuraea sp. NPDC050310 TaxID=3154935 RepID=UPI0033E31776
MTNISAGGVTLAYRALGAADAPPMVLLHGRCANRNDWNGIVRDLAATYRVYTLDLRGHGESSRPGAYALPEMAEDVRAFLDALGIERAVVVGHSLGGMVAYHLAAAHPERVSALVMEDPPPPLPLTRPPLEEDTGDPNFDREMLVQTERQFTAPDPAWAPGLQRITAPTLVVSGGATSHVPAPRTAELIPGARLVTIEAGHLVHFTQPAAFLAAVTDFLAALPA